MILSTQPSLEDLARTLQEKERKELLEKITRSISLYGKLRDSIYPKEIEEEERQALIWSEIERLPWLKKLSLWLNTFFLSRSREEIFFNWKIKTLKRIIQNKQSGLISFDTGTLNPKLAKAFFNLYVVVHPLINIFQELWGTPSILENTITDLLEKKIPDAKKDVFQLVPIEEMGDLYAKKGEKSIIFPEIRRRIDSYVDSIPESLFSVIEKQILPVYNIKDVVLFPFNSFFKLFRFSDNQDTKEPTFKKASAKLALEHLEKIYYAVYIAGKSEDTLNIDKDFAENLCNSLGMREKNKTEGVGELLPEITGEFFLNKINQIIAEAKSFYFNIPLAEIIRFIRKDPYYQLLVYTPRIHLKEFYQSALKIRFLNDVEKNMTEIQRRVIQRKIGELFRGKNPSNLFYYREYAGIDYKKMGLTHFSRIKSLNLLFNYLKVFYRSQLLETIRILNLGTAQVNRVTLNKLLQHAANLEDLEDKIKQFDLTLSPDEEDGKLFHRLRAMLNIDSKHRTIYLNLISRKDEEVEELIRRATENFSGVKDIFEGILSGTNRNPKTGTDIHFHIGGERLTVKEILEKQISHIESFLSLLYHLSRIEKESF